MAHIRTEPDTNSYTFGGAQHISANDEAPTLIADMADDLLELAKGCIKQTPNGIPSECFTWTEQPASLCCDYLSVSPHTIRPIANTTGQQESGFPHENFHHLKECTNFYWVPRFDIHLGRKCAPMISGSSSGRVQDPSPESRSAWARNIMIDTQVLSCCILESLVAGGFKVGGKQWRLEQLFPQQVQIDQIGPCTILEFKIMFDTTDYCCLPEDYQYELVENC